MCTFQDGPHPSQGRVVSAIGEDGWVRVEWDTGSRNSYRMGKNGKYDLKLADTVQYFDEDDKEDTEKGKLFHKKHFPDHIFLEFLGILIMKT